MCQKLICRAHNLLRDIITYGCPRYLLLSKKSSIVQSCSKEIRHVFIQIDMTLKGYNPNYESCFADRFAISERINVITTNIKVSKFYNCTTLHWDHGRFQECQIIDKSFVCSTYCSRKVTKTNLCIVTGDCSHKGLIKRTVLSWHGNSLSICLIDDIFPLI